MRLVLKYIPLMAIIAAVGAIEVDDLRRKARQKTDSVRDESSARRDKILARYGEFKTDMQRIKPGLDLSMPLDTANAGKMRVIDHSELPGVPEMKRVFAVVTQDYTLRTWHSESDSQKLDKVTGGERVEVLMVVNPRSGEGAFAWALVRTAAENEGYLPQSYLKNVPEQTTTTTAKKESKYVFISSGLRMRSEPSVAGEFLTLVPYDAEVVVTKYSSNKETVDGVSDFWAGIVYEGKEGWVFNGYLRPVAQKPSPEPPQVGAGGFAMPVSGRLTSKYGPRIDPVTHKAGDFHKGIDIAAPTGEPIKAAKEGEVFDSAYNKWWGNYVLLKHSGNVYTLYCHQSRTKSKKGQRVPTGEVIGYVGRTGKATGPHLHFEVRLGSDTQDPLQYLPK